MNTNTNTPYLTRRAARRKYTLRQVALGVVVGFTLLAGSQALFLSALPDLGPAAPVEAAPVEAVPPAAEVVVL